MKQKWFSRWLCLLLILAAFAMSLISCGKPTTKPGTGTTAPVVNGGTDVTLDPNSEEALMKPGTKQYDKEFRILATSNWFYNYQYWYNFDELGDPVGTVDKAVYKRQEILYAMYGIDVKLVASDDVGTTLNNAATSGTYVCDVVTLKGTDSMTVTQKGNLYDLNKFSQLNLGATYYDQNIQSEYRIGNRLFQIDGDFSYVDELRTQCVGFSKKLYNDYGYNEEYGSPYDLVRDIKWTYETMYNMYHGKGEDLNGDGKYTDTDRFGLIGDSSVPYVLLRGGGIRIFDNDNGKLVLKVGEASTKEQMLTALMKLTAAHAETDFLSHDFTGWTAGDRATVATAIFANNQALFRFTTFSALLRLLDEDFDFGVLPVPALYDGQDRYYSTCLADWHEPLSIAVNGRTQEDLALAAEMLEIFAYHSRYYNGTKDSVYEAFYENLSELRLCKTSQDQEMVQLLFRNKTYDIDVALNLIGVKSIVTNLCLEQRYSNITSDLEVAITSGGYLAGLYEKEIEKVCPN